MSDIKLIKNRLPKLLKAFLLLYPFLIAVFQVQTLDNDFYFLYPTGEFIVNHGFPATDFLSMHSNMKIVVQQWLSSVVFFHVYSLWGKIGMFVLLNACYALICYLNYRLILLITKNELISLFVAFCSNILIYPLIIFTRPQIFTILLLQIEIILLEKFLQKRHIAFLLGIPLISLALINLHASMWLMLFVFLLPFLAELILEAKKKKNRKDCIALFIDLAVCFAVGFINPYGKENVLYLFNSYGQDKLNTTILEMSATSWNTSYGKALLMIVIGLILLFVYFKKYTFSTRFILLFLGTLLLAIMHVKGIAYFYLFGLAAFSDSLKDLEVKPTDIPKLNKAVKTLLMTGLFVFSAIMCILLYSRSEAAEENIMKHYQNLDEAISILKESDTPICLYANFDDGQYLEFNGFHPYIDGRAELFLEQNNKEFDYYGEYCAITSAEMYYRDFTDKYGFNNLILNKTSDSYLYESLLHDSDFEIAYEAEDIVLFTVKD